MLRIPLATYRLQFNYRFTFKQALEFLPYFYELGISDLYASPFLKSLSQSVHGYDIVDFNQLNPEIGTEEELEKLVQHLHSLNMGLIADIVPNHMSIAESANKWWQDVLENGPSSFFAKHFNIIWNPIKIELKNKILLAVLDQQYGKVLENQELKCVYDNGSFFVEYKGQRFPLNPRTWPVILTPVVKDLLTQLKEDHPGILELQSIITALDHLPSMTELDPEKCKERNREKEIIKKRLATLVEETPVIKSLIQSSMDKLNGQKGNPHSFDALEELLKSQAYRLSFWRVSNEEINYRRFFDISNLVSMRAEEDETFDAMHELILEYVKRGWITGLRIDHVDGLFDPQHYFFKLQESCSKVLNEQHEGVNRHYYLIAEKILGAQEQLRTHWLVFGTTGYDYLNLVNGIYVVKENENQIKQIYDRFIAQSHEMEEIFYTCKKLILTVSMSSELQILARQLEGICEQHRLSRDYTLETLRSALRDIIACFPVYRSYIRWMDTKVEEEDRKFITTAIQQAKRLNPASDPSVFDFIQNVLLLEDFTELTEDEHLHCRRFVMNFQQLTAPVTAKGEEDTAFYRYYPLASLNEVGMDPYGFGTAIEHFHNINKERLQKWPHSMLTTSTHDTKRSEDVRARINVLSEHPDSWEKTLNRWHELNLNHKVIVDNKKIPDRNEEYLLYQTLIGSWPLYSMDASSRAQYVDRIEKYMIKAMKEAKIHTSWINPNEQYEKGVQEFIQRILNLDPNNPFLKDFEKFIPPIIKAGMFNSLSQSILKMTTPGIPDFYQGTELWEFNLVDPDNRRAVDYSNRQNLLKMLKEKSKEDPAQLVTQLMETPEDGRIKLFITSQILNYRREHALLFQEGEYIPLNVNGDKGAHVIAFCRKKDQQRLIIVVSRFYSQLCSLETIKPIGKIWENTQILLPDELKGEYRDILSGLSVGSEDNSLAAEHIFSKLPFAILT